MAALATVLQAIDERVSLKHVHRRLQAFARVLIVGTFMDDALRVMCDYRGQAATMKSVGWGVSLPPGSQAAVQSLMPSVFIATQTIGVLLILTRLAPQAGCLVLVAWAGVHPFMYAQQKNLEFLLESVTIIGGLLILLTSERAIATRERLLGGGGGVLGTPAEQKEAQANEKNQLLFAGRLMLCAVFVYYSVKMSIERVQALLGGPINHEDPIHALFALFVLLLLVSGTGLIIVGIKSRWCAMGLALVMGCAALYKHPWFITMWSSNSFKLDFVVGYEDVQVDAWLYSDHQRYFFFQQLSTVGALLQLVAHGPGQFSVDEADAESITITSITSKGAD